MIYPAGTELLCRVCNALICTLKRDVSPGDRFERAAFTFAGPTPEAGTLVTCYKCGYEHHGPPGKTSLMGPRLRFPPPKESTMIKPTIGRQVWFWREALADRGPDEQPEAATVSYVWSDNMVNLQVIDHNGNARSCTSVPLIQPGSIAPSGYYCEWMPYQIQVAQREAAQSEGLSYREPIKDS